MSKHVQSIPIPEQTVLAGANPQSDVLHLVSDKAAPHRPAFDPRPSSLGPSLTLPIQFVCHLYNGKTASDSLDLSSHSSITALQAPFGFAELASFEVAFYPSIAAADHPFSVDLAWMPVSRSPATQFLNTPGAESFVCGGKTGYPAVHVFPCDLSRFSRVLKSPYLPSDRIKLAINFESTTAQAGLCRVVIRANILVAYPTGH